MSYIERIRGTQPGSAHAEPNMEDLFAKGAEADSGPVPGGYFAALRNGAVATPAPPPGADVVRRETMHPYAEAIRVAWLQRLDNLPRPWVAGACWDTESFVTARKLVELANSAWAGYGMTDARADFLAHAPFNGAWDLREKKWGQALEYSGGNALPEPEPGAPLPQVVTLLDPDAHVHQVEAPKLREVRLTPASEIPIRPVRWLWDQRIALGTLALLGGREGIGKSTVAYQLAADLTNGLLPGTAHGKPRAVIVAATEDSWSHTIVPRLEAADANLNLIYRVDVQTYAGFETGLSLPRDLTALEGAVGQVDAALILLDPLMSRLDATLDTHKDAEVRLALEPLVRVADKSGAAILGLIHLNKSMSTDPLTMLMGSRAFAAVARAVLFCMVDPDDEGTRVLGQPKNNLGRTDLPTLGFTIVSAHVADTEEGPVYTGQVRWSGESTRSLTDMIQSTAEGSEARTATQEAADWLTDWLTSQGGTDDSSSIKREGIKAGHSADCLKRARRRIDATVTSEGFPRHTFWTLPGTSVGANQSERPVGANPGESAPTALTTPTAPTETQSEQSEQSEQWEQWVGPHREAAPTGGKR